jgi:molybdopterin molybdotransferase
MNLPQVDALHTEVEQLAEQLSSVANETVAITEVAGKVLAAPLVADRDSPPLDVSAMDGYAIRIQDLVGEPLPVVHTAAAGSPPTQLQSGTAVRIFTGAAVPKSADAVIKREDTHESATEVSIPLAAESIQRGLNIRRQGENTKMGSAILPAGTVIDSAAMAAVASFSGPQLSVRRTVRVTILNTGDELASPGQHVDAWQIRDSNGPMLENWLKSLPWAELVRRRQVSDQLTEVEQALASALEESDAVILTGGVSMGDADFVPEAIERVGGKIAFHRLPIRPGRPVLGASAEGKLILGLPGNPVSVAVTSRVIGLPLLRKLAGISPVRGPLPAHRVTQTDAATLHLIWYRLVQLRPDGSLTFASNRGSGDLVSLASSSGFVEIPPGKGGEGPWPFYGW